MEAEPVINAATVFAIAIMRLASTAIKTVIHELDFLSSGLGADLGRSELVLPETLKGILARERPMPCVSARGVG